MKFEIEQENIDINRNKRSDFELSSCLEQDNTDIPSVKPQNSVFFPRVSSILTNLLHEFSRRDDRLKWVNVSNILYGTRRYYRNSQNLDNDEVIKELVNEILDFIYSLKNNNRISSDDIEYKNLIKLNENIIYSRIANCIETWHI